MTQQGLFEVDLAGNRIGKTGCQASSPPQAGVLLGERTTDERYHPRRRRAGVAFPSSPPEAGCSRLDDSTACLGETLDLVA
jgi:hypothetical protein